ncbi:hypothetical protein OIU77_020794 [Salix suchowensis]|uniref:Uncharacterized protein n=1 Tax=Salix suchowensis TaxID=1278906 RepID=A0ABQ9CAI1_9ROSI|nr:hypothetical protein OIU77_020794 [Salix suchowensis]
MLLTTGHYNVKHLGLNHPNWSTCPAMQCESSLLSIGNSTTSGCNITTCAYAGFNKTQTIFTTLATRSTCPVTEAPGNYASRIGLSWDFLLISLHLILLLVYLL